MVLSSDIKPTLVRTIEEFAEATQTWRYDIPVVADVETYGLDPKDGKLLGIALCSVEAPTQPLYVVVNYYDYATSTWHINPEYDRLLEHLRLYLSQVQLVGHNFAYDKSWLDHVLQIDTKWKACTRVMWHMASAPAGPRPYGLKDAQVEVLGWDQRGDVELEEQVEARGGSIKAGGHYLADLSLLGHYACLDGGSTALLFNHLTPFFDEHDYWWMLDKMVEYSWLLQQCTNAGIRVDVAEFESFIETLEHTKAAYTARFFELAAVHIDRLERVWREHKAASYSTTSQGIAAKEQFLASWAMQKKFKISSDKNKKELFYDELKLPVMQETDSGAPSTAFDALAASVRESKRTDLNELIDVLGHVENADMLLSNYCRPWLEIVRKGRINPRFNPCGTVSYRISGYKPYFLNAPFEEEQMMACFKCDEGWEGVHADFNSVEPCVTAHYSQDPNLLKVFRDGLGDVYLDLALTLQKELGLFKEFDLINQYDPFAPITSAIKEQFKKPRKISKIPHLAAQYGGKKYTISQNLTFAGYPTTLAEGEAIANAYWKHFRKVAVMNESLFIRFERQGYLRNVVGRIIRVPKAISIRRKDGKIWEKPVRYKDLPSRFIQSSAHDLLSFWALKIARLVRERGITAKPMIVDCHDSTSWQAPREQVPALEQVFQDALKELNEEVRMTVPVKIEMKRFHTLAGLKGEE